MKIFIQTVEQYTTTIYKIGKQQGPTAIAQGTIFSILSYNGRDSEKECMYVHVTESFCCTLETNTTL